MHVSSTYITGQKAGAAQLFVEMGRWLRKPVRAALLPGSALLITRFPVAQAEGEERSKQTA
jgi:hypothetical protein